MKNNVINSITFLLILLWIYAAVSKLADYNLFTGQLHMQPLPEWSVAVLAWLLPAIEITAALLLTYTKSRSFGLALSFVLLLLFTNYTAVALSGAFGKIPCSCGGIFSFMGWKGHLIFNTAAMVVTLLGWYMCSFSFELTSINTRKYYAHKGK